MLGSFDTHRTLLLGFDIVNYYQVNLYQGEKPAVNLIWPWSGVHHEEVQLVLVEVVSFEIKDFQFVKLVDVNFWHLYQTGK